MTDLIRTLNEIAEEFECEVVEGNEFAYYYSESLIVVDTTDNDNDFLSFARKNGLNEEVGSFVISFFHELGHNETGDDVEYYKGNKDLLTKEEYYKLEEEFEATIWAINYCNKHIELVRKIQKML